MKIVFVRRLIDIDKQTQKKEAKPQQYYAELPSNWILSNDRRTCIYLVIVFFLWIVSNQLLRQNPKRNQALNMSIENEWKKKRAY